MRAVVVERWWNGSWGRLSRYDLSLVRTDADESTAWYVRAQHGGAESTRIWWSPPHETETAARAHLVAIRDKRAGRWTQLSGTGGPGDGSAAAATDASR